MKPFVTFVAALIYAGCAGLGTAAYARGGHGHFHAGGPRTPAYLVVDIDEIHSADDVEGMLSKIKSTLPASNGHVIVDSPGVNSLDGAAPARFVVIQFENVEKAREWGASDDGKEFEAVRRRATKSREFTVLGLPIEAGLAFGGPNSAARQEMMKIRDQEIKSLTNICKGC